MKMILEEEIERKMSNANENRPALQQKIASLDVKIGEVKKFHDECKNERDIILQNLRRGA